MTCQYHNQVIRPLRTATTAQDIGAAGTDIWSCCRAFDRLARNATLGNIAGTRAVTGSHLLPLQRLASDKAALTSPELSDSSSVGEPLSDAVSQLAT